jgi:hypothetical protein
MGMIMIVHEFRPLSADEMQSLLERRWTPIGINLPETSFTPKVIARLIRVTSGNLRLLTRLLTQDRTSPQRQRRSGCFSRNRRSRSRQPRHLSGPIVMLRQTIPKTLRQIKPQATVLDILVNPAQMLPPDR